MHTACAHRGLAAAMALWSVKLPFAEYSVVKERRDAHRPHAYRCRNLPTLFRSDKFFKRDVRARSAEPGPSGARRGRRDSMSRHVQRGLKGLAPNKVENTGLEPVTSWLQTRRSPS